MRGRQRRIGQVMAGGGLMGLMGLCQAASLSDVFVPQMLGAPVASLERVTGTATHIQGDQRHYVLKGCPLEVVVRQGQVVRLGAELSAPCKPDLSPFLSLRSPVPAFPPTFGQLSALGARLHYEADCLAGCDGLHQAHLFGYVRPDRAHHGLSVLLVADTQTTATFQVGQVWRQTMTTKTNEVYVMEGTFNCDGLMDQVAAPLLKDVVVQRVWVAEDDLDPGQCH